MLSTVVKIFTGLALLPLALCGDCFLCETITDYPVRWHYVVPDGRTCLDVYVDLSNINENHPTCSSQRDDNRELCCGEEEPPAGPPTNPPTPVWGNEPICNVCRTEEFPGLPTNIIHVRYVGTDSCTGFYDKGRSGNIPSFMCAPMQEYAQENCGCGKYNPHCIEDETKCFGYNGPPVAPDTPEPTKRPTLRPTASPTESPTKSPTKGPTASSPTESPTKSPTKSPTESPTESPTKSPTKRPTRAPTPAPPPPAPYCGFWDRIFGRCPKPAPPAPPPPPPPTPRPTLRPTPAPTPSPTPGPTPAPTPSPTPGPTVSPTKFDAPSHWMGSAPPPSIDDVKCFDQYQGQGWGKAPPDTSVVPNFLEPGDCRASSHCAGLGDNYCCLKDYCLCGILRTQDDCNP